MIIPYLLILQIAGTKAASILGVFIIGTRSHFEFGQSIMKSLHAAGHQVTIISSFEETEPVENFTSISTAPPSIEAIARGSINDFVKLSFSAYFELALPLIEQSCDNFLKSKYYQEILNSPKSKFDVLIVEMVPCLLHLVQIAEKFDSPVILANPLQTETYIDHLFGDPRPQSVSPAEFFYMPPHMNFFNRLQNTIYHLYIQLTMLQLYRRMLSEANDDDRQILSSYDTKLRKTSALLFKNSHSSLFAAPFIQSVIEIGGIQVKPIESLPQDMQNFIDESSAGVILFTFGSVSKGSFLSSSVVSIFKDVFSQIPQRIIWKYEESIEDLPENVMISSWLPQRDILAHKNVVAFITHCGIGGIYEAIYESIPLVMIPLNGDQLTNAAALETKGVGVALKFLKLSKEKLRNALDLVVNETSYRENMRKLSQRFKDRPMTPQESVVYWTEHVISHRGASHLKSDLVDMPLYQFYFLDIRVFLVVSLTVFLLYIFIRLLMRLCFNKIRAFNTNIKQN